MYQIVVKERNDFASLLRKRVLKEDKDVLVAIVGPQGYGKSTLSQWLMIHTTEPPDGVILYERDILSNTVWLPSEYMERLATIPEYSAVTLEEGGNAVDHRAFMSAINTAIRQTQQTIRRRHIFKFINLPIFTEIDPDLRRHFQYLIELEDKNKKMAWGTVKELSVDRFTGKIYRKTIMRIEFPPLPKKLYKLYDKKKLAIEMKRYEKRVSELREIEEYASFSPEERAAHTLVNNLELILRKKGKKKGEPDVTTLAALANVSRYTAERVCKIYNIQGIQGVKKKYLSH